MKDDQDFIHQHPLMTTAAALGVGLLAPIGVSSLLQNGTEKPGDEQPASPRLAKDPEHTDTADQDFIHEHPLMTTAIALAIGLLAPIGLSLMAQSNTGAPAENNADADKKQRKKTASAPKDPDAADGSDQDFIHEHPLMTTAVALGVGLLVPLGISLLAQGNSEAAAENNAGADKTQSKKPSAGTIDPDAADGPDQDFVHEHPLMTTLVALAIGLLAPVGLNLIAQGNTETTAENNDDANDIEREKASAETTTPKSAGTPEEDFIHQHPLMTTAIALAIGLLAPIGLGLLAQGNKAGAEAPSKKASAENKALDSTGAPDEDLFHQHPFMTVAAALGIGLLLGPAGMTWLNQNSADKSQRAEPDSTQSKKEHASAAKPDAAFVHEHPFMTTTAALTVGLLAPIVLSLLAQGDTGNAAEKTAEDANAQSNKAPAQSADPDVASTADQDFIHQHPFMTTAAALGIGLLLGPAGLNWLTQYEANKTRDQEPDSNQSKEAVAEKAGLNKKNPAHADVSGEDFIQQHPFMTTAAALGVRMLAGPIGLNLLAQHGAVKPDTAQTKGLKDRVSPAAIFRPMTAGINLPWHLILPNSVTDRRPHDVGALDMEFTTHRPDGKNIDFSFGWKKRPVDAPETTWPVDNMGFTVDRPNGKHVAFRIARKTRPIPTGYGDSSANGIRPGLGQATMKFASSRPDRGEFRFTWEKIPPGAAHTDTQPPTRSSTDDESPILEASTTGAQKKRPVSKTSS